MKTYTEQEVTNMIDQALEEEVGPFIDSLAQMVAKAVQTLTDVYNKVNVLDDPVADEVRDIIKKSANEITNDLVTLLRG